MSTYYWDIKFDFNAGQIAVGLVNVVSGIAQNITQTCTLTEKHGYAHNFAEQDSVCFNIFDGNGGCTLNSASIIFTDSNNASNSPFGGSSTISLDSTALAANQSSWSAAFPNLWLRHWVFPQYTATATGTFYFRITLGVTSGGNTKTISTDPEMIVGGTN